MPASRHILLINPTITSPRHARFPLAILNVAAALDARFSTTLIDGNVDRDFVATAVNAAAMGSVAAVGVTVMGGPQLVSAIAVSKAIRACRPELPIVWGGSFPTICPDAALSSAYVDFAIRAQGERTFVELLDALAAGGAPTLDSIAGLTWRRDDDIVHNSERSFSASGLARMLPYGKLQNPQQYLPRTYLGGRTAGYQAGLGCRFRCTFCGVAAMFRGKMALPTAARLEQDLAFLSTQLGVDAIQFYDHNFFDREVDMLPLLETLAKFQFRWWCYARADALVNLSERSWALVRKSGLKMAYIGAESPSDWMLHDIRKGTRRDQTLEAVEICRRHGVIPELSFMLAPPSAPEEETEKTFEFIRHIKRMHPATEVMNYIYTPLPARTGLAGSAQELRDCVGRPVVFPTTADGWAEPRWVDYWCHQDAPWVSPRLRQRIIDFATVLGCRFPTVMDVRTSRWSRYALRALAAWRYRFERYDHPWELQASRKIIRAWDPRIFGL